jgi:hypothetical protein
MVSRVAGLPVANKGLLAIYRDDVVPLMINPTNVQQTRLWAKVEMPLCMAVFGVLYVVGVWAVWGYPWYTCLVLWVMVGPHFITYSLMRAASVKYGPESSWPVGTVTGTQAGTETESRRVNNSASARTRARAGDTGIRNVSCGAPLLLVSCVRHLLCVVAFSSSLAYTAPSDPTNHTAASVPSGDPTFLAALLPPYLATFLATDIYAYSVGTLLLQLLMALYFCAEYYAPLLSNQFLFKYPQTGSVMSERTVYTYAKALRGFGGLCLSLVGLFGSYRYVVPNVLWLVRSWVIAKWMSEPILDEPPTAVCHDDYRYFIIFFLDFASSFIFPILYVCLAMAPVPLSYLSLSWRLGWLSQISLLPLPPPTSILPVTVRYCCAAFIFVCRGWTHFVRDALFLLTRRAMETALPRYLCQTPYTGPPVRPVTPTMAVPPTRGDTVFLCVSADSTSATTFADYGELRAGVIEQAVHIEGRGPESILYCVRLLPSSMFQKPRGAGNALLGVSIDQVMAVKYRAGQLYYTD